MMVVKTLLEHGFTPEPKAEVDVVCEDAVEGAVLTWGRLKDDAPDPTTAWTYLERWDRGPQPAWLIWAVLSRSGARLHVAMRFEFSDASRAPPDSDWFFMDTDVDGPREGRAPMTDALNAWVEHAERAQRAEETRLSDAETDEEV